MHASGVEQAHETLLKHKCFVTSLSVVTVTSFIAVTIMGCLSIAGIIGGAIPSYITLGLGIGGALSGALLGGFLQNRKFTWLQLFLITYFAVVGSLGAAGIINSVHLGYAMIAPSLLIASIMALGGCCLICSVTCFGKSTYFHYDAQRLANTQRN